MLWIVILDSSLDWISGNASTIHCQCTWSVDPWPQQDVMMSTKKWPSIHHHRSSMIWQPKAVVPKWDCHKDQILDAFALGPVQSSTWIPVWKIILVLVTGEGLRFWWMLNARSKYCQSTDMYVSTSTHLHIQTWRRFFNVAHKSSSLVQYILHSCMHYIYMCATSA